MAQQWHRRSIRLKGYDYSQAGAYFVTLCTHNRECLFGKIVDGEMRLNELGHIVCEEWLRSAEIRPEIMLDAFVVMPNHLHGIVIFTPVGAHGRAPLPSPSPQPPHRKPRSLGSFIAGFKSVVTKRINQTRQTPGIPVWQRNYYEHIIRNQESLARIRRYIADNPAKWDVDPENPTRKL